jgi:hypothetical protein
MNPLLRMIVVLSFSATALVLTTPTAALARPCCSNSVTYFEDCSFSNVIGVATFDCNGQHGGWGGTSNAVYFEQEWCGNPSCCSEAPCDYICQTESYYACY